MPLYSLPIVQALPVPPAHVCVACLDDERMDVHLFYIPEKRLAALVPGWNGKLSKGEEPPCLPVILSRIGPAEVFFREGLPPSPEPAKVYLSSRRCAPSP